MRYRRSGGIAARGPAVCRRGGRARRFVASRRRHRPSAAPGDRIRVLWLHSSTLWDRWPGSAMIAPCHLPRPGGVRRTDRSGVGCSHREGCPLFPLLNASLRGWREYYCDSADRWHECARYKLSLTGRLVPITLLPNGHDAQLLRPDPDAGRSGAAGPKAASGEAPPSRLNSGSPETVVAMAQFEPGPTPVPARTLDPSPPSQVPQPESEPTSAPALTLDPSPPSQVPQPSDGTPARLTRPGRRAHGSTHRWWTRLASWWTRLTHWMTGPA